MSSNKAISAHIRDYQPADFPALCALDRLCFPEGIAYPPGEMALGLAQPGAFALVAVVAPQVVAFVLACQQKRQLGHITTIDVHPEFRHQGLGTRLMELAQQSLKAKGTARLILEVGVENETAIRFYEKLGYLIRRVLPHYYRDGSDAYLMEKILS